MNEEYQENRDTETILSVDKSNSSWFKG